MEENHESGFNVEDFTAPNNNNKDHGWQKVVYPKRQRKTAAKGGDGNTNDVRANGNGVKSNNVFRSVELHADDRRRRITEAQKANDVEVVSRSRKQHRGSDDDDEDYGSDEEGAENGGKVEEKKPKVKKIKKPKVSVQEAASKIDASDLAAFLVDVTASYESQQDIQLMRFADYFARAFSNVLASQFPWTKTFKESPIAKIADIPISYISEDVYKTSVDWINQRSPEALGSFVLWSLDSILADLAAHVQVASKGSKKAVQQVSSKAQVAIFVVLAMTLRRKPDVLISLLPTLRENKYQGQDKLPVLVWAATQACHGDLAVGMYAWAYNFLPVINAKSCNPQSRDLILQLVERILSTPKARPILLNSAVRKGERMIPPSAFELLMRLTFPASSARVKATERFEAAYPVLKEVALAGSPGSKAMKQVTQQIFTFSLKAVGESAPELSKEAAGVCIWSLTQNTDIYKHWDKVYLENVGASAAILKKLSNEWKEHSVKHLSLDPLRVALKSFKQKNEEELADVEKSSQHASIREANKYCKVLLGRSSRNHGCLKGMAVALVAVAVGAFVMSPDMMESLDLEKIKTMFGNVVSV